MLDACFKYNVRGLQMAVQRITNPEDQPTLQKPLGCLNVLFGDLLCRHLNTISMEKGQGSSLKWELYGSELLWL